MVMELPTVIDCRKIPEHGLLLEGILSPDRISRIAPEFKISAPVRAQINVKIGAADKIHLVGELSAELTSSCQRCLEGMQINIETEFEFELRENEPLDNKFSDGLEKENITLTKGILYLTEVLEDEILLSCPMIPSHVGIGSCSPNLRKNSRQPEDDRQRPFADLDKIVKNNAK